MKKIIPFVLLLALLLPFGAKVGLVANYWMNQKQYLELCQNKDKPAMKCNGKCHLAKQMAEVAKLSEESNPKKPVLPESVKFEIAAFFVPYQSKIVIHCFSDATKFDFPYQTPISKAHLISVFHPPLV